MKVAFISLPDVNTPVQEVFTNMHGYWTPPDFVMSFWATACKVEYVDDIDYENKKKIVHESYMNTISQFYKDNAL